MQSYDVDAATILSVHATFCSVFRTFETWQINEADLLFGGSRQPVRFDVPQLRQRIAHPPLKTPGARRA